MTPPRFDPALPCCTPRPPPARGTSSPSGCGRRSGRRGDAPCFVADVVAALSRWRESHADFVVATNEAGMRLAGASRGADAAVWRRADLGGYAGGFRRVPPVLAVDVAGVEEGDTEADLRAKADWYLCAGVALVWIVLPGSREVLVLHREGEARRGLGRELPEHPLLPGLAPRVDDLFRQISE